MIPLINHDSRVSGEQGSVVMKFTQIYPRSTSSPRSTEYRSGDWAPLGVKKGLRPRAPRNLVKTCENRMGFSD